MWRERREKGVKRGAGTGGKEWLEGDFWLLELPIGKKYVPLLALYDAGKIS